jgi:hypothetical protein
MKINAAFKRKCERLTQLQFDLIKNRSTINNFYLSLFLSIQGEKLEVIQRKAGLVSNTIYLIREKLVTDDWNSFIRKLDNKIIHLGVHKSIKKNI